MERKVRILLILKKKKGKFYYTTAETQQLSLTKIHYYILYYHV